MSKDDQSRILELYQEVWKDSSKWNVNLNKCESVLMKWIELDPTNELNLTNMGAVLCDLGRHREALNFLKLAEQIGSKDKNLYWNIGVAKMNLDEERPTAMEYFNKAKKLKANPMTINSYFDPHGH